MHSGRVEALKFEPVLLTQTAGEGGRIPPSIKAPAGYDGDDGIPPVFRGPLLPPKGNPEHYSEEEFDCILMLALDDSRMKLPGFDDFLRRHPDIMTPDIHPPTKNETAAFLSTCKRSGLIRQKPPGDRLLTGAKAIWNSVFSK